VRWRAVVLAAAILGATAAQATGTTAVLIDPAHRLLASINDARAARGLVPLQADLRLWAIAGVRAGRLASSDILSHEAAGSLPDDLAARNVRWYGYGEDIGYASGTAGVAAGAIFGMWSASSVHWTLLMSPGYNYLGVGLAAAAGSGVTFASVVLTESPDRTGAQAVMAGTAVSTDDIRWSWRGWDPLLQTHTAGVRDFSVQLRMDRGAWVTIANGTSAQDRSTLNRIRGHWYGMRVRARDRAGNVGPWSRELRVWLP
jgi:uncharacterized protein YkwD